MTNEEITKLAEEAGISFSRLISQSGKDIFLTDGSQRLEKIIVFAKLVAAAEREACAEIAEQMPRVWDERAPDPQHRIAAAIRNRSNK